MNKIEFKTSAGKFMFITVPTEAYELRLEKISSSKQINYYIGEFNTIGSFRSLEIDKSISKIIGLISELTEEQCQEVVESYQASLSDDIIGFADYLDFGYGCKDTATESFKSLCESLNVDLTQNWLLIKLL